MSLLVDIDINGTTNYLSQEGIALDRYYDAKITKFDPPQYKLAKRWGGYTRLSFGGISFFPDLFENDWVPPTSSNIVIKYTSSNIDSAVTLFTGTAHISKIDRTEIKYDVHGQKYSGSTILGDTFTDVPFKDVFTACAVTLGLSLDTSLARSSNTEINHTVSSEKEITDLLSDISAFYTHSYYIDADTDTLYLQDMFQDNGTTTITEFDYFPSNYEFNTPVSVITSGQFNSGVTYPYGKGISQTPYVQTAASAGVALANIWEIYHKTNTNLNIPLVEPLPTLPGLRVQWTDTAQGVDTSAYLRVRTVRYDFDKEEVRITGEGEIESV